MEEKQNKGLQNIALLLIGAAVIWTGYVFCKTGTKYAGTDGDAFNGMAGPVISLVGAVLVYLSFQQQYKANQLQKQSLEKTLQQNIELKNYDILDKLLSDLVIEFKDYNHAPHANHRGSDQDFRKLLLEIFTHLNQGKVFPNTPYFMSLTYSLMYKLSVAYGYVIGAKCNSLHRHMLKLKIDSLYMDYFWDYWNDTTINEAVLKTYDKAIEEMDDKDKQQIPRDFINLMRLLDQYWNTENAFMNSQTFILNEENNIQTN